MTDKLLVVITGPTGVGKSDLALRLSERYHTPIISADSRQIYRGMEIGTDASSSDLLPLVPHHFIGVKSVSEYYSASMYEAEALSCIERVHQGGDIALLVGGSMMYIDAVVKGIDDIPDVAPEVRHELWRRWETEGLEPLREELKVLDPLYLSTVDPNNYKRIIHALEVCQTTGRPFSSYHTHSVKPRPFKILKIGLTRDREELYARINDRVLSMIHRGLVEEVRKLLPYRHLNALNTVGYKEVFGYLEGLWDLDTCIRKIQKNTRVYARKQLSWYRRDADMSWYHPSEVEQVIAQIDSALRPSD